MSRPLTLKQQKFVAAYVGEANGNATEACRLAGYAGDHVVLASAGYDNLRKPQIADAIREATAQIDRSGIAIKQGRIDAKLERWRALTSVRLARAAAFRQIVAEDAKLPAHRQRPVPPGWEAGLHVRQVKAIPTGRGGSEVVEEFALDATMLRELDTLERDIAQELGEIETKVGVRHSGTVRQIQERVDLSALSNDEVDQLAALAAKIDAGTVAP